MISACEHDLSHPWARMRCLWEEGHFSDVTVRTQDAEYRLHKAILRKKSKFFFTALNGKWKESKEGVIEIKHLHPSTAKAMLQFMYLGDYDQHEVDVPFIDQLLDHADIHAAGIMYQVDGLPDISARNFEYVFKDDHERYQIDAVVKIIPVLCETIPENVDSQLVTDVAEFVANLVADECFGGLSRHEALRDVLSKFGAFNIEVYARLHAKWCEPKELQCNHTWGEDEPEPNGGENGEW